MRASMEEGVLKTCIGGLSVRGARSYGEIRDTLGADAALVGAVLDEPRALGGGILRLATGAAPGGGEGHH